jgi:hypothetical protein
MAANLPRPSTEENVSTTLNGGIDDTETTITVDSAAKLVAPCYLVIDRVDSNGDLKDSSLWEYVKVTNIAGSDLTVTRGANNSTNQAHTTGAVVEAVVTSAMFEDWYTALNPEHTAAGGHVISTATVETLVVSTHISASGASISGTLTTDPLVLGTLNATTHLNVSGASISGIGLNPTWYIPALPSLATTGLGRPMAMPRAGTLQFVNVTLNGIISSPSIYFDINKNFVSLFDAGTRPLLANTTFVSTASLATKNFKAGDVLSVDLDHGGNSIDATITASSY